MTLSAAGQSRLVERLGSYSAMLLRNHGTLVVSRTEAEALC
ncbi:MAG: class II aldolase/adducin family protein [Oxalobacteraceae bacterium]